MSDNETITAPDEIVDSATENMETTDETVKIAGRESNKEFISGEMLISKRSDDAKTNAEAVRLKFVGLSTALRTEFSTHTDVVYFATLHGAEINTEFHMSDPIAHSEAIGWQYVDTRPTCRKICASFEFRAPFEFRVAKKELLPYLKKNGIWLAKNPSKCKSDPRCRFAVLPHLPSGAVFRQTLANDLNRALNAILDTKTDEYKTKFNVPIDFIFDVVALKGNEATTFNAAKVSTPIICLDCHRMQHDLYVDLIQLAYDQVLPSQKSPNRLHAVPVSFKSHPKASTERKVLFDALKSHAQFESQYHVEWIIGTTRILMYRIAADIMTQCPKIVLIAPDRLTDSHGKWLIACSKTDATDVATFLTNTFPTLAAAAVKPDDVPPPHTSSKPSIRPNRGPCDSIRINTMKSAFEKNPWFDDSVTLATAANTSVAAASTATSTAAGLSTVASASEPAITQLTADVKSLSALVTAATTRIDTLEKTPRPSSPSDSLPALVSRVDELSVRLDNFDTTSTNFSNRMDTLHGAHTATNTKIDTLEKTIEDMSSATGVLTTLGTKMTAVDTNVDKLLPLVKLLPSLNNLLSQSSATSDSGSSRRKSNLPTNTKRTRSLSPNVTKNAMQVDGEAPPSRKNKTPKTNKPNAPGPRATGSKK